MKKNIKHTNMLRPNPGLEQEGVNYFRFTCRGCTMMSRENTWRGFRSSVASGFDRENDNSYLSLEEEPDNAYDPNAVMVVCRGEFFGTVGYVGKEYALEVKKILEACRAYRVDMVDENDVGKREVGLMLTWE